MLRIISVLVAIAALPLLLAPPQESCVRCVIRALSIPISIEQGEGSWHELEVQPNTRYTVRLETLTGESNVELFSLNPNAELAELKCSGDEKRSKCTFRAKEYGLLGLYVEPKTRVADAVIELTQGE